MEKEITDMTLKRELFMQVTLYFSYHKATVIFLYFYYYVLSFNIFLTSQHKTLLQRRTFVQISLYMNVVTCTYKFEH